MDYVNNLRIGNGSGLHLEDCSTYNPHLNGKYVYVPTENVMALRDCMIAEGQGSVKYLTEVFDKGSDTEKISLIKSWLYNKFNFISIYQALSERLPIDSDRGQLNSYGETMYSSEETELYGDMSNQGSIFADEETAPNIIEEYEREIEELKQSKIELSDSNIDLITQNRAYLSELEELRGRKAEVEIEKQPEYIKAIESLEDKKLAVKTLELENERLKEQLENIKKSDELLEERNKTIEALVADNENLNKELKTQLLKLEMSEARAIRLTKALENMPSVMTDFLGIKEVRNIFKALQDVPSSEYKKVIERMLVDLSESEEDTKDRDMTIVFSWIFNTLVKFGYIDVNN